MAVVRGQVVDGGRTPAEVEAGYARALAEEQEGYRRAGKDDRVKEVQAELDRLGYEVEEPEGAEEKKSSSGRSRRTAKKSSSSQQTR